MVRLFLSFNSQRKSLKRFADRTCFISKVAILKYFDILRMWDDPVI